MADEEMKLAEDAPAYVTAALHHHQIDLPVLSPTV
jgi:hypothetical protein